MAVSFISATVLQHAVFRIPNPRDYCALRIAVTFPNIVALPILIFPSLCEYPVVYQNYIGGDVEEARGQCEALSNTMIFCYFFSWSLAFWSFGYPQLMAAAHMNTDTDSEGEVSSEEDVAVTADKKHDSEAPEDDDGSSRAEEHNPVEASQSTQPAPKTDDHNDSNQAEPRKTCLSNLAHAMRQTFTSPGFLVLVAGFITGCIAPLQSALFDAGGAIRFLGSALQTLGQASSPMSTLVVAASLVPPHPAPMDESGATNHSQPDQDNPIMSDPNFGPYRRRRSSLMRLGQSMRRTSVRLLETTRTTPELRRLLLWFVASRLILAPAIVTGTIAGLECSGYLSAVPDLAKLVIIVNASVPGALIIVVLLKARPELDDTTAAVAKVYLPTYLVSIVSIAGWTALGLWLTLPDENGLTVCERLS